MTILDSSTDTVTAQHNYEGRSFRFDGGYPLHVVEDTIWEQYPHSMPTLVNEFWANSHSLITGNRGISPFEALLEDPNVHYQSSNDSQILVVLNDTFLTAVHQPDRTSSRLDVQFIQNYPDFSQTNDDRLPEPHWTDMSQLTNGNKFLGIEVIFDRTTDNYDRPRTGTIENTAIEGKIRIDETGTLIFKALRQVIWGEVVVSSQNNRYANHSHYRNLCDLLKNQRLIALAIHNAAQCFDKLYRETSPPPPHWVN